MTRKTLIASLIGVAALAAGAVGLSLPNPAHAAAPQPREASIPFVSNGGIRDWHAADRDTLYVEDSHRHWYRAELMGPCHDLPFAQAIGFEGRGTDSFDRFSSVVVRGQRCAVQSLTASAPPPAKAKKVRGVARSTRQS